MSQKPVGWGCDPPCSLQELKGKIYFFLYNHEVYEDYNGLDVVELIRLNRLRWAGHLYRMSEDDPALKVFSGSI